MRSRVLMVTVLTTLCVADVFCPKIGSTAEEEGGGQEVLVECPNWHWGASEIPGVVYELCFDDIDHCAVANIGDAVCIPSMGRHDVWVTAIDYRGADPIYYDGEVSPILRVGSADFDGDGIVGVFDIFTWAEDFNTTGDKPTDLDGDRLVGLSDLFLILDAIAKCVSDTGFLYETC